MRRRVATPVAWCVLVTVLLLTGPVCAQDVGSFLAGLLGGGGAQGSEDAHPANASASASLEPQQGSPCPGECVHALTSILCSRVVDSFDCGAGYLRCCVHGDFAFGTVVETSAPLPEEASDSAAETSSPSSSNYDVLLLTTTVKDNSLQTTPSPSRPPDAYSQAASTVARPQGSAAGGKLRPCPGLCVENVFVRYCSATYPDGWCEPGSTCCASHTDNGAADDDRQAATTTTIATTTTTTTTTTDPPRVVHPQQSNQYHDVAGGGTLVASTLPPCPGSCVSAFFSLFCDSVDDGFYCGEEGGRCCVSSDDPSFTTPSTTTTTTQRPSAPPCPGTCIPAFLRGMCNRPSEVVPATDCEPDLVCCFQPDVKEYLHVESPQIPLLRPGGYPPIPAPPQGNSPYFGQPAGGGYPYPQAPPQAPYVPSPAIVLPTGQGQGPGNQVFFGNSPSGYAAVPVPHSQTMVHGGQLAQEGTMVKVPYQPNYGSYSPQGLIPLTKAQNTSLEVQTVRLNVLPPAGHPGTVHSEDVSKIVPLPPQQHQPALRPHPHHGPHNDPLRFVPPPSSPVLRPPSDDRRQQVVSHDRFVEAAIGFAPDPLRHPPLEKFQPPSPQPAFVKQIKNGSTILVLHLDDPENVEVVEKVEIQPAVAHEKPTRMEYPGKPVMIESPLKPLMADSPARPPAIEPPRRPGLVEPPHVMKDPPVMPVIIDTGFRPVQDSFKPLMPQPPYRPSTPPPATSTTTTTTTTPAPAPAPPLAPVITKPVLPMEDALASPSSNANFFSLSAEEAKRIRPACPGSCIASFLRFTCYGNNAIYDGFACEGGSGLMCCSAVDYIEKYEEHLKSGEPLTFVKPDSNGNHLSLPVEPTRRPGMYVCGIKGSQRRKTARIMGGKTSSPGEWCWQVALINAKNQYLCGGALIGSRWVLTAAHCITALVRNGDPIYVRVGDFDLASQVGSPGAQTQKVSTTYIHHNHNGQTLDNDVALLRLENPVHLQESVCLVCLPVRGAESQPGTRCKVTGYGYVSESGPIALKVREAELPIVEEKLCTEQINNVTEKTFVLPTGSFCAGGEPHNDACQGDGGGPLTCLNEGYYELTGLVSWGFGCGKENVPGVYVKVSSYIGWINQIISVNN